VAFSGDTKTTKPPTPELVAILSPFVVAFLLLLASPLLTRKVQNFVVAQISRDTEAYLKNYPADQRDNILREIPPPLKVPDICDHLGYMADAVQIFPYGLLPVVGGLFAIVSSISTAVALVIFIASIVVMLVLDSWTLAGSTSSYAARNFFGYTPVICVGLVGNALAILAIMVLG